MWGAVQFDGCMVKVPLGNIAHAVIVCLVLPTKRLTVRRSMYVDEVSVVCLNVM